MKNLRILILLISLITLFSSQIYTNNKSIEEKLRRAIRENNPKKVEKYLKHGADINYIYPDTKKILIYEALQNLANQSNKIFIAKILGSFFAVGLSIVGISIKDLMKNSIPNAKDFIDHYINFDYKVTACRGIKLYDISEVKRYIGIYEENIKRLESSDMESKERLLDVTKNDLEFQKRRLNILQKVYDDPDSHIKSHMNKAGIKALAGFLSVISVIMGMAGLIYKIKAAYNSLINAKKIVLMIQNQPDFKLDSNSAEFMIDRMPQLF